MIGGYDVYIRKVVEGGKPIFPEAICLTEVERLDAVAKGNKGLESIERLKNSNQHKFYGQYLNDPLDESTIEFKRDWFHTYQLTPQLVSQLAQTPALISIDPAYSLSKAADFTGVVVTKTLPDNSVYVLLATGVKVNTPMFIEYVFSLVKNFNPYKVLIEANQSQTVLRHLLTEEMGKRNTFFVLEDVKPESNEMKVARIRGLIPHYANGRIFHAPGLQALEDQLIEFPKGAHDDIIDALAYQWKYWHKPSEKDQTTGVSEGSFAWWKSKTHKPTSRIGMLFQDFKR